MRRPSRTFLLALLLLALAATAGRGDLIVFTHGDYLRVAQWRVDGDRIHLLLPGGGRMVLPILRVERILEEPEKDPPTPPAPPPFALAFDPAQPTPATPFGELIRQAAERHDLNPALLAAVAGAESSYDPGAVSIKGARGLMQLMPATAERFGLDSARIHDPSANLDAGARYLRWLADRFDGHLPSVLASYNAGEGSVVRYGGVPPYRETRNYLRRIYTALGLPETEALETASTSSSPAATAPSRSSSR